MINLHISLFNPWAKDRFKSIASWHGGISKYKGWEIEITASDYEAFGTTFKVTTKQDHAGVELSVTLFFCSFDVRIYDSRHWDYEKNQWQEISE